MEDLNIEGRIKTRFKLTIEVLRLNSLQDKMLFLIQNLQPTLCHALLPFNVFRWVFAAGFRRSGCETVDMLLTTVKVMNENGYSSGSHMAFRQAKEHICRCSGDNYLLLTYSLHGAESFLRN